MANCFLVSFHLRFVPLANLRHTPEFQANHISNGTLAVHKNFLGEGGVGDVNAFTAGNPFLGQITCN